MQNERYTQLLAQLGTIGITYHEYVMLQLAFYEPRKPNDAARYARFLLNGAYPNRPSDEDCQNAITTMIDRGLLQIISNHSLAHIREYLRANPARGPILGLPEIGQLDLTLDGFEIWRELWVWNDWLPDEFGLICYSYRKPRDVTIFSMDADDAIQAAKESDFAMIGIPEPIGPWRSNWWNLMPRGYVLRCLEPLDK